MSTLVPNKKQWRAWSLPSKLTAVGVIVSLLSLGLYLLEKGYTLSTATSEVDASHDENKPGERAATLVTLGSKLYTYGLASDTTPATTDTLKWREEVPLLFNRLGLPMPDQELGPKLFAATRDALGTDQERTFLDVGTLLASAHMYGLGIILHPGSAYSSRSIEGLERNVIPRLEARLVALGLLSELEARDFVRRLRPMKGETKETFSSRVDLIEAEIVGRARSIYGI